jgi:chorismate-pyruvate lyase
MVLVTSPKPELSLLYPLTEFYEESGLPLPAIARLEESAVPEPYKSLLVHERDMTPTVAEAYHRSVGLRVLKHSLRDNVFSRQIVLVLEGDEKPVVFGAIKIYLERFPLEARRLIQEMRQPLGTILQSQRIAHASRPEAYLQVTADTLINNALRLTGSHLLFGRRNVLWNAAHEPLAQVLEILPPADFLQ